MDLALGFAPQARRNSKMALPLSSFRSKSIDDSMTIHIPMGSDPPSIFSPPGSCRLTRFVMGPQCDASSCNYMQKSAQFGRSGRGFQKIMVPKEPSLAISISRQTIVGGFVGSKTYAGRSMFADSSQIWDALVCKFVELISLVKEKPVSTEPKSKMQSTVSVNCVSGEGHMWNHINSNDDVGSPKRVPCSSSNECLPRNIRISTVTETSNVVPSDSVPLVCKAVEPECGVSSHSSTKEVFPHHKGTYSSVVDGSFKKECASVGSCTEVKISEKYQHPEASQTGVQHVPMQSYADVAKTIPSKTQKIPPKKNSSETPQTLGNMWICKTKRFKSTPNRKGMNLKGNKSRTIAMGDILTCGDTRWRGDWKSKREKFQMKCPEAAAPNVYSSTSTETSEDSCAKNSFIKESETDSDLDCKWSADENEPTRPGCLKDGLRGRHLSECSLDSEDSFVIFEDPPDTTLGTPPGVSMEPNSLEGCGSENDNSCSSSGSSDDEDEDDDDVDGGDQLARFHCPSKSRVKEDFIWMKKCSAQTVPEISKGMKKKTVHFAVGSNLAVVRPMIAWDFAYRESRRGPWEVHARDRARFHIRIASLAPILNAILDPIHRQKVKSRLNDV